MNMSLIIIEEKYGAIDTDNIHVMVTTLSSFIHLYIPFNQTLVLIGGLFILLKWYMKEIISFQQKPILIIMFKKN